MNLARPVPSYVVRIACAAKLARPLRRSLTLGGVSFGVFVRALRSPFAAGVYGQEQDAGGVRVGTGATGLAPSAPGPSRTLGLPLRSHSSTWVDRLHRA